MMWYTVQQLPWPMDRSHLFGREAPLLMEIGFGSGQFLAQLARRFPDNDFLGVEIALPSLRSAARKVERAGLANVLLLRASAEAALQALLEPESLQGVIINFPDPWPKEGHRARRLIQDRFLCLLASRMCAGAELDIATDHSEYAFEIAACLRTSPYFDSRALTDFTRDDPGRLPTKYESWARAEGRIPYYFHWRRNTTPIPHRFTPPEEFAMPHVVLRTPAQLDELAQRFRPTHEQLESVHIKFLEVYQSARDEALLVETYINEEPIEQRIGLLVRARAGGDVIVEPHAIGFPRPTRGVHLAVGRLTAWIEREYPATVVVNSTLQPIHAATDN